MLPGNLLVVHCVVAIHQFLCFIRLKKVLPTYRIELNPFIFLLNKEFQILRYAACSLPAQIQWLDWHYQSPITDATFEV